MTDPRHRRHVSRRTTVIGLGLAFTLGAGLVAVLVVGDTIVRPLLAVVLLIAVAAGVLAVDEARTVEARLSAELSRERAHRSRDLQETHERIAVLLDRIDGLERELGSVRSRLFSASRTTVIVAPDRKRPRILELPDVLPAAVSDDDAQLVIDLTDDGTLTEPIVGDAEDTIDLTDDEFPTVEVVGEFNLEGLRLFGRPAGMPERFPSIQAAATESSDDLSSTATEESDVVDLRDRISRTA